MHLSIAERPGVKSSESLLRKMVAVDRKWRHLSPWIFVNGPRPRTTLASLAMYRMFDVRSHSFTLIV